MKQKAIKIILILLISCFLLTGCSSNNTQEQSNTGATRISTDVNVTDQTPSSEEKETVISTYSTNIKDNSAGRLTNIQLTCKSLNSTIIQPGETFSFNEMVGKPTAEKGYQEATVIIDHKSEKGIGGGNCQVSSTLYNALLNIPSLTILERHEHGKDVTYVPEGKDAAVSYGSLDLKFRNDYGSTIRIDISSDDKNIIASIVKI